MLRKRNGGWPAWRGHIGNEAGRGAVASSGRIGKAVGSGKARNGWRADEKRLRSRRIVTGTRTWNGVCNDTGHRQQRGPPGVDMNEQEFQSKLAELMTEISTLPATERKKLE